MLCQLERNSLDDEGLLRIPGSSSRVASLLQELETNFNPEGGNFEGVKSTDICSVLKQFIRCVGPLLEGGREGDNQFMILFLDDQGSTLATADKGASADVCRHS